MRLDDLDVELLAQRGRDLPRQPDEQVDAEAHVPRPHDHRMARGGRQLAQVVLPEPRRADHMHHPRLRGDGANSTVASGAVKSSTACACAKGSSGSSLTVTPSAAPPIATPTSCPIQSCPGRSTAPDEPRLGALEHGADEHPPHPPRRSRDDDPRLVHASRPLFPAVPIPPRPLGKAPACGRAREP
jgi:hypothetical protein